MAKVSIDWQRAKRLTATIIDHVAAGQAPEELKRFYQEMQPKAFAHWVHGFLCGVFDVVEFQDSKIRNYVRKVFKETKSP